ncbi:mediator of RNA polymerase II transcription subunit 17 [Trichomonascus vanleenenianus]|uniref:Srb4p n=1 Tax=Trichomonascus vanleenenianus TaxID=2268995 RepID=UPI003ECAF2B2
MEGGEKIQLTIEPQYSNDLEAAAHKPLAELIQRITAERGVFADLNEDDLLREIADQKQAEENNGEPVQGDEDEIMKNTEEEEQEEAAGAEAEEQNEIEGDDSNSNEARRQSFDKARAELVRLVGIAQNETGLSLDFVSLLLSCLRPAAGTTSMSPHLKQHVAVGSLSADELNIAIPEEDSRTGAGWKIQSLGTAAEMLQKASERLKGEVDKESKYWKCIYGIVNNGETLFKIRKGDVRGLGVKFGYGDAGSDYRDKGVAILKRKSDGNVAFKFDMEKRRHVVRVSIYEDKTFVGCSAYKDILVPEQSVHDEICNARTLIFEEELFFEIVREARRLSAHRVNVVDGKVVIGLQDQTIEIEHVDPQADEEEEDMVDEAAGDKPSESEEVSMKPDDTTYSIQADLICNTFRLLLCHTHRKNLTKRRSVPDPLVSKSKTIPSPPLILRPVIAHIQHDKVLKRATRLLELILSNYPGAKLQLNRFTGADEANTSYLGNLLYSPVSTYEVTAKNLTITIVTSSPLQAYIPLYEVTATQQDTNEMISKTGFYELSELEEWVNWILKTK